MHFSLGNTTRGLLSAAVLGDGAAVVSAWGGGVTWHEAIGTILGSLFVLGGALLDPGSKPAKT